MDQKTKEWFNRRAGKVTASAVHQIMGAGGLGQTGESYVYQLVSDMMGVLDEPIFGRPIQWGNENEPDARYYFELATKLKVTEKGFCQHLKLDAGCSPDGLIGDNEGIEIKCPYKPSNHVKHMTIKNNADLLKVNKQYYYQVLFSMWITGRSKWYFVSYDPRFTGKYRMHIVAIYPDQDVYKLFEQRVTEAINLRNYIINKIQKDD